MTHKALIASMRQTIIGLCHTNAFAKELAYKLGKNAPNLLAETPASKAVYVVELDRRLAALGWA